MTPEQRSAEARRAAHALWGTEPRPPAEPKPPRFCEHCGDRLAQANPRWRFCGKPECRLARNRDRMRVLGHEARRRGAMVERFHHLDVFERDGWICGICAGVVDPSLRHPHPESASLDHIVPLSAGGDHSAANAQCSHLICNTRKGSKVA